MGYLLPITEWQSIQYANRVQLMKLQPLKLSPVHTLRIQPLKNNRLPARLNTIHSTKSKKDGHKLKVIEAEITGKGRFINEYV